MVDLVSSGIGTFASGTTTAGRGLGLFIEDIPDNAVSVIDIAYIPTLDDSRFPVNFRDSSNNRLYAYYNHLRFIGDTSRDSTSTYSTTGSNQTLYLDYPNYSNGPNDDIASGLQLVVYNYGTTSPSTITWSNMSNEARQGYSILRFKDSSNSGYAAVSKIFYFLSSATSTASATYHYRLTKIRDISFS
jgi:hypothetical protein